MEALEAGGVLAKMLETDVPRRLRQRPRDPRGYPIPYVVLIREDGNPDSAPPTRTAG